MGIGSGIWIHSVARDGTPSERVFQWQEPPCYPLKDGTFWDPEDVEPTEEEMAAAAEAAEAVEEKYPEIVEAPRKPKKYIKKITS